jgi:hypothetical protein
MRHSTIPSLILLLVAAAALADDPTTPPKPPAPPSPPVDDAAPSEAPHAKLTPEIAADQVLTRIAYLASDELDGRESGTDGGRKAEEWVASEFRRFGLEPLSATADSPFTDVPMSGRAIPEQSWIDVGEPGAAQRIGSELGAQPFSFSKGGEARGQVVFAGFGITAADAGYDDYAGVDVKGKVVLVLRHGPAEKDAASPWHDPRRRMNELSFSAKAQRAADAGAAAILLVNDCNHADSGLPVDAAGEPSPIPVLAIRRPTADLLLAPTGRTLAQIQAEIDGDRKPRSRVLDGVVVGVHVTVASTNARNVVFVRRGSDEKLRDEAVVVCAHMDHVGRGFFGSIGDNAGRIHNGADDNASGTAALLEIAEAMAAGPATKRTLLFAAWCGEEKGLVGSRYFVEHPLWDLGRIACCVNLDMVGRYRDAAATDDGLYVCGMPAAIGTEEPVTRLAAAHKLKMTPSWEAWEQSDQLSFYLKSVPSLFLHTGLHADYHRPSDDWWKVVAEPEARIASMVVDLARDLADAPTRPTFAKKPPRLILGVRFADDGAGAKIAVVFPGFGANVAGLLPGDVLVSIAGRKVASTADVAAIVQTFKDGDVVDVAFLRGAEEKTAKVRVKGI